MNAKNSSPRFFEIEGHWKDDKTPIDGYVVCIGNKEQVSNDQEIFFYFDSMKELNEAMNSDSSEDFLITKYSEQ